MGTRNSGYRPALYAVKGGEVDAVLDCPSRSPVCMNFARTGKKKTGRRLF